MTPAHPENVEIDAALARERPPDPQARRIATHPLFLAAVGLLLASTGSPAAIAQERPGQGLPELIAPMAQVVPLPLPPLAPAWPGTPAAPVPPGWSASPGAPSAPDRRAASVTTAPTVLLSAALKAVTVDLRGDSSSNIYRAIWHDVFDQELAIRQKFSEKTNRPIISTTNVFAANFDVPKGKIIVSATDEPGNGCQSYTNIGLSPSLMSCPMRVAFVQPNEIKIIYSSKSFPFSIGVTDEGQFDNENPAN